jgi:hypothetical protein
MYQESGLRILSQLAAGIFGHLLGYRIRPIPVVPGDDWPNGMCGKVDNLSHEAIFESLTRPLICAFTPLDEESS